MRRTLLLPLLLAASILAAPAAHAQTDPPDELDESALVDFAFSAQLGTGVYSVGNRTVYVLRLPIRFWIRRDDSDRWGYRVLLPVAFGLHDFHPLDFLEEEFPSLDLQTVTILPGLEARRKLYGRWLLRPFAHLGAGKDLSGGSVTLVYDVGIRSRVLFPWKKWEFSLGNKLMYAGASPVESGPSSFFVQFDTGFDARREIRATAKRKHFFSVFTIYHFYFEPIEFRVLPQEEVRVFNTVEFGFAYGVDPKAKLWRFRLPQIGMSYEVGRDFWAVRLSVGFPF